jgi:glycosyltransferase involved in cell wall biosynthesis
VDGVTVRRFKITERDTERFDRINYKLINNKKVSLKEEQAFIREMVNSEGLYSYISVNGKNYDYFLFIPYMFGTTYYGSQIHPEKSILIPCLHDESYAYMDIYRQMFEGASGLVYLSEPEKELANRLFDIKCRQMFIGGGVDTDVTYDVNRFRDKYKIKEDFILYAGRRDPGKNVPLLLDYYCSYKDRNANDLKLVLIGSGDVDIPVKYQRDIIDLGFVSKQDKYDAYSAAMVLCQPSLNESFSIVIMESWLCDTPVLVHADCTVTKGHCINSNGGIYFKDYDEFEGCIDFYLKNSKMGNRMAENGKLYVNNNYSWSKIVKNYVDFFTEM